MLFCAALQKISKTFIVRMRRVLKVKGKDMSRRHNLAMTAALFFVVLSLDFYTMVRPPRTRQSGSTAAWAMPTPNAGSLGGFTIATRLKVA
jgi:hypothetical protein